MPRVSVLLLAFMASIALVSGRRSRLIGAPVVLTARELRDPELIARAQEALTIGSNGQLQIIRITYGTHQVVAGIKYVLDVSATNFGVVSDYRCMLIWVDQPWEHKIPVNVQLDCIEPPILHPVSGQDTKEEQDDVHF